MPVPGGTTARGYGYAHQRLRAALMADAIGKPCARCGQPMLQGQELHLDHTDDRDGYRGMAHATCNVKAGARKGGRARARQRTARRGWRTSRDW